MGSSKDVSVVMDRKLLSDRPSFFKVLIEDYNPKLILPPAFAKQYRNVLPARVYIRSSSGANWKVRIEDFQDEGICFTGEGWNKFAEDANLRIGEFLVFWYNVSISSFDVKVYGTSCCERQIWVDKGTPGSYIKPETAHTSFFRIIMNSNDNKLRIPREFVRRSGLNFENEVLLKVATESVSKVEQGSSHFDVLIFDKTATEIKGLHLDRGMEETVPESDDSVEFLGETWSSMKSEEKMKMQKHADERGRCITAEIRKRRKSERITMSGKKTRKSDKRCSKGFEKQPLETETIVADLGGASPYDRAKRFVPAKWPCGSFVICLVRKLYHLSIPMSFARTILPDKRNKLELRCNGKTWYVSCSTSEKGALIRGGWRIFVNENGLQRGDACIFKVSKGLQLVWNVTIFRN